MRRLALTLVFTGLIVLVHAVTSSAGPANLHVNQPHTEALLTEGSFQAYLPVTLNDGPVSSPPSFLETFTGVPLSPLPWQPAHWDLTVHSRDVRIPGTLTPMHAQHGPLCEPPPVTHLTTTIEGAVFNCRDHMMTAINEESYGVIYLTPDAQIDFSSGTAVIKFDVSTLRASHRDWIDLWITPFDENLQLPLQTFYPDLNGPPRRAIHIFMDSFNGETPFRAEVYDDFEAQPVDGNWWTGYEQFLTPSASRRDTFELIISKGHLKFGMPDYDWWWIDQDIAELNWTQGVVQFGHHSYNPEKDCDFDGTCGPTTWHWDNISIVPAIPFSIIRAHERYVNAVTGGWATLAEAAPTNAHLRFAGLGEDLEVSFDGGVTWQLAQIQAQVENIEGHAQSYWMPLPTGVTQVRFRGEEWWGGDWQVQDISVWSLNDH